MFQKEGQIDGSIYTLQKSFHGTYLRPVCHKSIFYIHGLSVARTIFGVGGVMVNGLGVVGGGQNGFWQQGLL